VFSRCWCSRGRVVTPAPRGGRAQVFAGFLLSIVFVQSHNGMEVYNDEKDFITAQVVSTRDITAGVWNDWFTGLPPPPPRGRPALPRPRSIYVACRLDSVAPVQLVASAANPCP